MTSRRVQGALRVFRVAQLKPLQEEAVAGAMAGRPLFLQLPTAFGKSLCYQVPAVAQDGLTVVVSPLLSLIQDQTRKLRDAGVRVAALTSAEAPEKREAALRRAVTGAASAPRVLFATPERLADDAAVRGALEQLAGAGQLERLVVDEAHCVVEWGDAFRPAYRRMAGWVAERLRPVGVPVTLLSSTVTREARDDVLDAFAMGGQETLVVSASLDRPNLALNVAPKPPDVAAAIAREAAGDWRGTLVFTLTRGEAQSLAKALQRRAGLPPGAVEVYHAGLTVAQRQRAQRLWMSGRADVLVATVAFGMGIDRVDVRRVVHASLPVSLGTYFQQVGRAGRGGEEAECTLYYSPADAARAREVVGRGEGDLGGSRVAVHDVQAWCELEGQCRRVPLLAAFGEEFDAEGCSRRCNCFSSVAGLSSLGGSVDERDPLEWRVDAARRHMEAVLGPKHKKRQLPSKAVLRRIAAQRPSREELAAMRGVDEALVGEHEWLEEHLYD